MVISHKPWHMAYSLVPPIKRWSNLFACSTPVHCTGWLDRWLEARNPYHLMISLRKDKAKIEEIKRAANVLSKDLEAADSSHKNLDMQLTQPDSNDAPESLESVSSSNSLNDSYDMCTFFNLDGSRTRTALTDSILEEASLDESTNVESGNKPQPKPVIVLEDDEWKIELKMHEGKRSIIALCKLQYGDTLPLEQKMPLKVRYYSQTFKAKYHQ